MICEADRAMIAIDERESAGRGKAARRSISRSLEMSHTDRHEV